MEMNSNNEELHAIEAELHTEILPGTEIMRDVASHHFVKDRSGSNRVLIPQPSDDPADPLNWSLKWKMLAITGASMTSFFQGFGPLSLAPMFPDYIEAFHCSLADAVQFTGVCILVLGFSNFIWVPLSTSFGRRPVYIASNLICLASMIWRARAQTYGSFMGACVLNGIGAGPAESIQPAVIADIFFLHDRGKWNTLYWVVYMGSLMIGPIIGGSMALNVGWRNFWWFNVALGAVVVIYIIFLFPETKWHRPHPNEIIEEARANEKIEGSANVSHAEASRPNSDGITEHVTGAEKEGTTPEGFTDLSTSETAARDPYLGRGKPAKWQFRFFQPNPHPFKAILLDLWIPWKLFAFPIVQFASFVVSWSCSSFLTINLTQSQVLAAPPYNFSTQTIGFTNFAIFAGALIGLATGGPLSDWVAAKLTARNNGIREPEMRLVAMIPFVLIMYLGNIIVSVGYENHWPWEVIVLIGYSCAGIQVAALPSISSTYAVDSYKPVAGSLFVSITVNKNVWGYGFSKFITPWSIKAGFIPPIMTNGSLVFLWCLFGVVFYYYGKTFRRWTKNSSVHRL
ncbi:related to HOL1, putative substrate-H+ antiporter [Fusarium fujikuroi]|nr:related to HOL1, putative substrate-H+ antiporter [Fusarium fujikuroi IMI 58289]SCN71519.1 related to HOL1, putative substrate-H+ antiporter [Fusarium fujikuroi]CCT65017.1 related to HOL1, putative substrate-H+ antiporter [Fusarium fujikuroi IMI 58289]SCN90450.1 related to HOL1, putative substrate-H+ antiporter [Fusarium fujikuroi]SCO09088.1 related to HOL1, putative substrate-H+ antiporter [Fusarium fujikuroi]SCO25927.1 related to HOL1, putative substrate-H+ antiporter [Fusarium fujikuroi]